MELKMNLSFENIFGMAKQLPSSEKEKLISALKSTLSKKHKGKKARKLGKYNGEIWMSDDFNAPLSDFKAYMP